MACTTHRKWGSDRTRGEEAAPPCKGGRAQPYFTLLWLLWVAGAWAASWAAVILVALPASVRLMDRGVGHLLRPPGHEEAKAGVPSLAVTCLDRGLRGILIIGALLWLAHVWSVHIGDIATQNTFVSIMRAILTAIIVILIADFAWSVARTLIDTSMEEANSAGEVTVEEQRRRARLRTLLPIMRVALLVFILALRGDDGTCLARGADRSTDRERGRRRRRRRLRSADASERHLQRYILPARRCLPHRRIHPEWHLQGRGRGLQPALGEAAPSRTVLSTPFLSECLVPSGIVRAGTGSLRKLNVGVTYDSDIDKARKIVRKVGQELAADPELAAGMMEPLKMQGVQEFGDFAVQLRLKMKTRPGDVQFIARRRALSLIKKAFDANGIKFAYPTVQVAGAAANATDEAVTATVAKKGLELVKPKAMLEKPPI